MMKDLIDKKTVALVGNSQSLFNYQYGSEIDDHDVVIRINNTAIYYDDNRRTHGTRNTIWAFWDVLKFLTSQKQYRGPRTDEFFALRNFHCLNLYGATDKAFDETRKTMGFSPREQEGEKANPVNEAAEGKTGNTTPAAAPSSQPSVATQSAENALNKAGEAVEKATAKTEPVILPINKTKVINTSSEVVVTTKSTNASYPTK